MTTSEAPEQLALLRSTVRRTRKAPPRRGPEPAAGLPVARVIVDVPLAHLDRPFDYLVPAGMADVAAPGVRVRVRFSGRLVGGYLAERAEASGYEGQLAFLHAVVSAEQVLTPVLHTLSREVADRYAGTLPDVLRLAIPPRHARVEAGASAATAPLAEPADHGPKVAPPPPHPVHRPEAGGWSRYARGPALLDAVHAGTAARAVWSALPGPTWPDELARLALTTLAGGRGALLVLPDLRDVERVDAALRALAGDAQHVVLSAQPGPAERYRRWLSVLRGHRRLVIGTRAAMFAPVDRLGLVAVWDDGDDLHAEPRAPYPHVREVLVLRSRLEGAALLVGGFSRTAEAAALVRSGWAQSITAPRAVVRRTAPVLRTGTDDPRDADAVAARLPSSAWRAAGQGLEHGPVLVQVPRSGYVPGLACATCRAAARCPRCHGPLGASQRAAPPACGWCATPAAAWSCTRCGGSSLRATSVGAGRTAEELGRAFPRTPVRSSGGASPALPEVPATPALVVATAGAEPVAEGGYAAALLLDGWMALGRPDLRAGEEALRRWLGAAALVRPAAEGGQVVVLADPAHPVVQALVRWDPAGFADRELTEREVLHLPPAAGVVSLSAEPASLTAFLAAADLPPGTDALGPVTLTDGQERLLLRCPRSRTRALVAAVRAAGGVRSAHKEAGPVRVQVDPTEVG